MSKTAITIGPLDNGRHMSLQEFDHAEGLQGRLYELGRGVIAVVDVPKRRHLAQVKEIKRQVHGYDIAHPGIIDTIATGSECKILIAALQSERHPDLAIYKTAVPEAEDFWATWIPEIVIEVVSAASAYRDYVEKRDEYLVFGVQEYWIIDADKEEMLVLRRWRRNWKEQTVRPPQVYRTRLLPGLEFSCAQVFDAAKGARE